MSPTQDQLCNRFFRPRHDWGEWEDGMLCSRRFCRNCGDEEQDARNAEFLNRCDQPKE